MDTSWEQCCCNVAPTFSISYSTYRQLAPFFSPKARRKGGRRVPLVTYFCKTLEVIPGEEFFLPLMTAADGSGIEITPSREESKSDRNPQGSIPPPPPNYIR